MSSDRIPPGPGFEAPDDLHRSEAGPVPDLTDEQADRLLVMLHEDLRAQRAEQFHRTEQALRELLEAYSPENAHGSPAFELVLRNAIDHVIRATWRAESLDPNPTNEGE